MAMPDATRAQLRQQFAGGLGLRHDQHFAQHAPQIKRRRRQILLERGARDPAISTTYPLYARSRGCDLPTRDKPEFGPLRSRKRAHHLIERRFNRQRVHVRPRHHDFPHLHLGQLNRADDKFFFAGSQQPTLASLLNLNLQFFGRMRDAVALRRGNAESFDDTRWKWSPEDR